LKTVLTNQRVVGSIEFFDPSALVEIRRRAQGDSLHRSSVSFLAPIISLSFSKVAAPRRVVEAFLSPQGGSYSAFCFEDGGQQQPRREKSLQRLSQRNGKPVFGLRSSLSGPS
jgi:hypothetical protein